MRNLVEVIENMLEFIPATHEWHHTLARYGQGLLYKAPEQMHEGFIEMQRWLASQLGATPVLIERGEEWKADVMSVWCTKSVEQMVVDNTIVFVAEARPA